MDDPSERAGSIEAMKPLRLRLEEARKRLGLPWEVLLRVDTWIGQTRECLGAHG